MPGKIIRITNQAKAKEKIENCRGAGMKINDNPITGITKAEFDGKEVLRCSLMGKNKYQLSYDEDFWEEITVLE